MSNINKILYYFKHDKRKLFSKLYIVIMRLPIIRHLIKDETYIKKNYEFATGRKLDFKNLSTFNEKLQWLKLYDRNSLYPILADKYLVREYIKNKIGNQYLISLIGVYDNAKDINWKSLPNKFVLKCNHASGTNIICQNKESLDKKKTIKILNKWLRTNYFWYSREWAYKDIKPRIICEKYMVDESGEELKDYKFFCFNGEPKLIQVDYNRFENHKRNIYDTSWNFIDVSIKYPNDESIIINKPVNLSKMLELARVLSSNFMHVRVDFYSINGDIYFGELTFYHGSGHELFNPRNLELKMGDWLTLPF